MAVFKETIRELEIVESRNDFLKDRIEGFQKQITEKEHTASMMEKMLESATKTSTEASKEKTIYEELFDRIFRSGESFSIQVGNAGK